MKNSELLSEVSNAKTAIERYTIAGLLDDTDSKHILCQKITNTAVALYLNALRIAHGKRQLLQTQEKTLSLSDITALMAGFLGIISKPLFSEEIEENIKQLLQTQGLNLEELWVANPSADAEIAKIRNILNGN